ncbi:hypothetical protein LM599_05910 [Candidatus Acetothermia bacterium]|nr:hypothetical protein [Candidatus Acetothermia bacterium]
MDDFERTEWGDSIYSAIGRLLTLATHFESSCRGLVGILQLKKAPHEILESPAGLKELSDTLWRHSLGRNILILAPTKDDFHHLLDNARRARNEIAHEIALGMEDQEGLERNKELFLGKIRELVLTLAEADRVVCLALTVLTHDHIPSNDFLKRYPERIAQWVCELE